MWIIDRYLLRQYVFTFVICFVSLTGLYTVIDAFGRLDDFTGEGRSLSEAFSAAAWYYSLQSIGFFNKTSGVLAMIAAMFTITWAQRHNEMTALLAAGLPRIRVLRSVIAAALVIAVISTLLRELVIPNLRTELAIDSKSVGGEALVELAPRYDNQSDILVGGQQVAIQRGVVVEPKFDLPPAFAADLGESITGSEAVYYKPTKERPAGFLIRDVERPINIDTRSSIFLHDGSPLVVTRRDAAWLKPGEVFVVTGVPIELLIAGGNWRDYASTAELIREMANPSTELGPDVSVAAHTRLAQPFLDATLLLIGLPLVVSRGARSPYIAVGLSIAVVAGFFLISLSGQSLGVGGWLSPAFAAWLPLFIFAPLAAAQSVTLNQ